MVMKYKMIVVELMMRLMESIEQWNTREQQTITMQEQNIKRKRNKRV